MKISYICIEKKVCNKIKKLLTRDQNFLSKWKGKDLVVIGGEGLDYMHREIYHTHATKHMVNS